MGANTPRHEVTDGADAADSANLVAERRLQTRWRPRSATPRVSVWSERRAHRRRVLGTRRGCVPDTERRTLGARCARHAAEV